MTQTIAQQEGADREKHASTCIYCPDCEVELRPETDEPCPCCNRCSACAPRNHVIAVGWTDRCDACFLSTGRQWVILSRDGSSYVYMIDTVEQIDRAREDMRELGVESAPACVGDPLTPDGDHYETGRMLWADK